MAETKNITESGLVKTGSGKVKGIIVNSHTSGTLALVDGTEGGAAASSVLTSAGACAPAYHATSKLTSTGAMVAATHAVSVLTSGGTNFKDVVKATGVLTSNETNPADGDTMTIGDIIYRFKTTPVQQYDIKLGATCAATIASAVKAINGNGNVSDYHISTIPHPDVVAVLTSTYVITVTAKVGGTAGNSIAKAEDSANLDWDGVGATLTGGLAAETVTIGSKVYTFKDELHAGSTANQVLIGATLTASLLNLKRAINATAGYEYISYAAGTVAHTQVVATASDVTTVTIRGRVPGTSLNTVATTETCADASWPDTTLGGGTGASDAGVTTTGALITIGGTIYTVVDELSENYGAAAIAYQVKKGAAVANMLDNLKLAINGTGTEGTNYSTGTVAHPDVVATTNTDTTQVIVAREVGDDAATAVINAIVTTTGMANHAWADTTLGGGTSDSNPGVTTAAAEIVIGERTYTAVTELSETSGADAVADEVLWVTNEATFLDNLKKAINASGIAGTDYSTGTTINTQVKATTNTNTQQTVVSRKLGTGGNAIATTTNLANYSWTSTVLASGTGAEGKTIGGTITLAAVTTVGDRFIPFYDAEFLTGLYITIGGTADITLVLD